MIAFELTVDVIIEISISAVTNIIFCLEENDFQQFAHFQFLICVYQYLNGILFLQVIRT